MDHWVVMPVVFLPHAGQNGELWKVVEKERVAIGERPLGGDLNSRI